MRTYAHLRTKEFMKYKVVTYGCQMNVHESEKVAGILENMGYTLAGESESSDVLVFNTCCIRDTAERRALGNIGVVKAEKRQNPDMIIVVIGCMPAQPGVADMIKERYPYVDIVLGTRNLDVLEHEIKTVIEKRSTKRKNDKKYRCFQVEEPNNYLERDEGLAQARTSFPNAWVNIIYGCKYLKYLLNKFEDINTTLCAYNAGETRVRTWLKSNYSTDGKTLNFIPFEETRKYVNKIQKNMKFYKKYFN